MTPLPASLHADDTAARLFAAGARMVQVILTLITSILHGPRTPDANFLRRLMKSQLRLAETIARRMVWMLAASLPPILPAAPRTAAFAGPSLPLGPGAPRRPAFCLTEAVSRQPPARPRAAPAPEKHQPADKSRIAARLLARIQARSAALADVLADPERAARRLLRRLSKKPAPLAPAILPDEAPPPVRACLADLDRAAHTARRHLSDTS
ncbi:hypothetical protein [Hyphomonas sp.]|uniref:hypothetical protein n=1 Tax=Hyphomonas sp. TaxID=87 RepID=UPI003918D4EF